MSMSLGPRPPQRPQGVSYVCHLATVRTYLAHHRACDGNSYTPSLIDPGIPCLCDCHTSARYTEAWED